jgi:hypothetical protein
LHLQLKAIMTSRLVGNLLLQANLHKTSGLPENGDFG